MTQCARITLNAHATMLTSSWCDQKNAACLVPPVSFTPWRCYSQSYSIVANLPGSSASTETTTTKTLEPLVRVTVNSTRMQPAPSAAKNPVRGQNQKCQCTNKRRVTTGHAPQNVGFNDSGERERVQFRSRCSHSDLFTRISHRGVIPSPNSALRACVPSVSA